MTSQMKQFLKMIKNFAQDNAQLLTTQEKAAVTRYCMASVDRNQGLHIRKHDPFSQLRLVPLKK